MATNWKSLLVSAARAALGAIADRDRAGAARERSHDRPTPRARRSNPSPEPRVPGTTAKRQKSSDQGEPGTSGSRPTYPGDFEGTVRPQYSPDLDGAPDPGEIVWTWVPYEEDHTRGKDRPVLLVGRDGQWLLALMLTSKDHSRDAADEARWGRRWLDIGTGPWDPEERDSQVRLDRVVRVDPQEVRREGAIMDRELFDRVTALIA